MFVRRQTARLRRALDEYPRTFWIVALATFIDSLGGFMLFPFFSLYLTHKFDVGMTQVGLLFGLFSITDLVGSFVGGALTDRFGRKSLTLFGLIVSAFVMLLLGLAATGPEAGHTHCPRPLTFSTRAAGRNSSACGGNGQISPSGCSRRASSHCTCHSPRRRGRAVLDTCSALPRREADRDQAVRVVSTLNPWERYNACAPALSAST